jgi:branched-chain amino acid transport system substrate-binding protein
MTERARCGDPAPRTTRTRGLLRARLAIVSVALLGVALSACTMPPRSGVSTTVVKPTGTCDASRVVEVGASLALSGPQGALGQQYLTGLKLAVDHVNSTGGVLKNHRCLELLYKNDRGSVPVAQRAVLDLIDQEQVSFLVGPFLSAQVEGARSSLARANIPVASFSTLNQTFHRAVHPWTFPLASSVSSTTTSMSQFGRAQGWHRVAVVATDDPAGREAAASLATSASRRGLIVGPSAFITSTHQTDQTLQRLRATHPDGLAVVGDTLAVADALRARQAIGWDIPVVASSIAVDPNVIEAVGHAGLAGVSVVVPQAIVAQPGISNADIRNFRDRLRTEQGRSELTGSVVPFAQGYDAISMLASSVQNAHSMTAANLRTYLENANYQGLLASYTYTASMHTGIPNDQQVVEPASHLSDGLFSATRGH